MNQEKPIIFISCGQATDSEKMLGKDIVDLVRELTPYEPYFAEFQSSLDGLTQNIFSKLKDAAGFISVMHYRGEYADLDGENHVRGSVWIEQEIAIAAFMTHTLGKQMQVKAFAQNGIRIEGVRQFIILNPVAFQHDSEVLSRLRTDLPKWEINVRVLNGNIENLKSQVTKLLRFPEAATDVITPPTFLEKLLTNKLPRRLFDLLMNYEETDILSVPEIGSVLHEHLNGYYNFRCSTKTYEDALISKIGQMVQVRFRDGWKIYYQYVMMRASGSSKEQIMAGSNFLRYEITWDDSERVFFELSKEMHIAVELLQKHESLVEALKNIQT